MTSYTTLSISLLTIVVVYKVLSVSISKYLWNKLSVVKDIPLLSKAREKKLPGVAIICGGSFSGLFAARVCANHFEKVIIVEPEEWVAAGEDHLGDADPPKRARVAQYTAYHHFQLSITSAMREMFGSQNFENAVRSIGGRLIHRISVFWMSGFPLSLPPGFSEQSTTMYPPAINLTRQGFETIVRRLVLQTCEGVQYFHGTVTGLVYDETANRVTGVNVKLPNGDTTEIKGNLVVDATGPFMGGFKWLKALPRYANSQLDNLKISFDPKVRYTGCYFTLPPKVEEDFRKYGLPTDEDALEKVYALLPVDGGSENFFVIEKKEKNILQLGCGGYDWHGDVRNLTALEEFVRQLKLKQPLPEWIYDILHTLQSENVPSQFVNYKYPLSVYIKYHEAPHLPSNFVVVGDAQSQTDPVLGQGCAKASGTAIILNSQLHRTTADSSGFLPENFAKDYFLDVKTRTEHIWANLKNVDYNFSTTVPLPGENIETTSWFMRTYGNIFMTLATVDADVCGAFLRQVAWIDPGTNAFAPWLATRIFWAWIKQSLFGKGIV